MISKRVEPLISVIIPVFNRPESLKNAIRSILAQSYKNFEVIVLDDGSNPVIANIFDDERITLLRHKTNKGSGAARNTAIRAAKGEYIAFLDSDDIWLPEKLSSQMAALLKQPEARAAITGHKLILPDRDARIVFSPKPESWLRFLMMGSDIGVGSTLLVERKCIDEVGFFDERLERYQDWDWLIQYVKKYPLCVLGEALTEREKQERASAEKIERSAKYFVEKHSKDFGAMGFYGSRALGKRWLEVATYYYAEGNKKKGFVYLLKTLRQNPFQRPSMYLRVVDGIFGSSLHYQISRMLNRFAK